MILLNVLNDVSSGMYMRAAVTRHLCTPAIYGSSKMVKRSEHAAIRVFVVLSFSVDSGRIVVTGIVLLRYMLHPRVMPPG